MQRPVLRVFLAGVLGATLVTLTVVVPGYGGRSGDLLHEYDASKRAFVDAKLAAKAEARPHTHNDPATKNLVSRAGATEADAQDPTTTTEKVMHATAVAAGRTLPAPTLREVSIARHYATTPRNRYEMAGGCYALGHSGTWAARTDDGLTLTARKPGGADPLYFKASDLGSYLLYDAQRQVLTQPSSALPLPGSKRATFTDQPTQQGIWRITQQGDGFVLKAGKNAYARVAGDRTVQVLGKPTVFDLRKVDGCQKFPESQIDIKGAPFGGTTSYEEVRGYVDAHTHGQAWEFLGGGAHCGKPWDPLGVTVALVDCPDHQTGVNPLEAFLSGEPAHDPVGWPTFKDWPAPESLTHEGTYYKWMERSWRGGQRLFVNLLVENNQLCKIYPYGPGGDPSAKKSCDDMDSLKRQADDMYQLQDYTNGRTLDFVLKVDDDVPAVLGDRNHLERVVENLVSNAVKFSPEGGSVEVRARRDGDEAVITVTDAGLGIAERDLPLVFDRFFRSALANHLQIQGTGLGLSVVQSLVRAHDGSVEIESQQDEGTVVTVRLPALPA